MCSDGADEGAASGSASRQDPSESPSGNGVEEEEAYADDGADVVGLEEDAEAEEDQEGEEDELAGSDTPSDDAAKASLKVKLKRGTPEPKKQPSKVKTKKSSAPKMAKGKKRAAGAYDTSLAQRVPD